MTKRLLLITHVPIRKQGDQYFIDDQTALGIAQWCRHFDAVTYVGVEDAAAPAMSSSAWVNLATAPETMRCTMIALPNAYRVADMVRHYRSTRALLARAIAEHDLLCFTIGGLVGDWPAIGALEAIRQKRDYVAWVDRVEPEIIRRTLAGAPLKRRIKSHLTLPLMERYQRFILSRSEKALLQGMDTYAYFASSAPHPHCIYDTHTRQSDMIEAPLVAAKTARILEGGPLEIVYTGRAAAMKGVWDWLDVLSALDDSGIPFRARWVGDGPELEAMRRRVESSRLKGKVVLPGFEADRGALLAALRESDLMLFCHKTPESPRCLIEALVSGCPLVGYDSPYAAGLVAADGGAALSPQDEVGALALTVKRLHQDRPRLAELVRAAAASGTHFDEDQVYQHRAQLMGADRSAVLQDA